MLVPPKLNVGGPTTADGDTGDSDAADDETEQAVGDIAVESG